MKTSTAKILLSITFVFSLEPVYSNDIDSVKIYREAPREKFEQDIGRGFLLPEEHSYQPEFIEILKNIIKPLLNKKEWKTEKSGDMTIIHLKPGNTPNISLSMTSSGKIKHIAVPELSWFAEYDFEKSIVSGFDFDGNLWSYRIKDKTYHHAGDKIICAQYEKDGFLLLKKSEIRCNKID